MDEQKLKIPTTWVETTFKNVALYIQRGKSPKYAEKSELPVINQKCVRWGGIEIKHLKYISPDQWSKWSKERFLQDRDILWNSTGTGTIGRACLYKGDLEKAVVDSHVTIVRVPHQFIAPEFVFFFIMSPFIQKDIDNMQAGSTNQVELGKTRIEETWIPIAPINEQKRIVDKIERLFSDIDEGEALLKTVQNQLGIYRQAVLKAAVTGELTRDWREKNKHHLESGGDLLKRILQERKENWMGKGKYKEPFNPTPLKNFYLPEKWNFATIDQIACAVDYGSSSKCSVENLGVPVLRMGNILEGRLNFDELKYLPPEHNEFPRLILENGDLVFNRTNSAELVGKTAVYNGKPKICSFASYLIRVRLIETQPEFVSSFINSGFGRSWIKSVVSQQVGQANVNGTKLKSLTLPLPPKKEQEEIVARLSDIYSQIDALENWCVTELMRSSMLRQSILKDAFLGRLVSQDPHDGPASELLKHIQVERASNGKSNPRKKKKSEAA